MNTGPPINQTTKTQGHLTQRQFGENAHRYASSIVHMGDSSLDILTRLVSSSDTPYQLVMDIGCGPGFTAFAMTAYSRRVIASDLSPGMVAQARRVAQDRGISGIDLAVTASSNLPIKDASVDLVTSRYAFHHMPNIQGVIIEINRVLAPGGVFVLADTVAPENQYIALWMNQMEVRRDYSHLLNRSSSQLRAIVESAEFRVTDQETTRTYLEFDSWVQRTNTPETEARRLRQEFLEAAPEVNEAFEIKTSKDRIEFSWPCLVLRAVKE